MNAMTMNELLLPIVAAALVAAAVMVVSASAIAHQRTAGMRRSLALVLRIGAIHPADATLADPTRESFVRTIVGDLADRLVTSKNRTRLKTHLALAGKPDLSDLRSALDRKLIYGTAGLTLGLLAVARFGLAGWLVVPVAVAIGYFIPDLLVYNAGLKRTQQILLTLPDALDLLDLCVESGLSLQASLAKVAETQSGPVAAEFGRVLHEMQLGVSRAAAFQALADRTTQEDLQRFVAAVLQVDKLGIPVAAVLKEQSREMRAKRHSRAREAAQKVPVKILAPLMLCFLPGLFIIILGPAAITVFDIFVRR